MNIGTNRFSFRTGLAAAAVTATVLMGASACVGSSTPAASAGTTGASSSPSAAGTVSIPAASSPAASAGPATGAGGAASSAGAGAPASSAAGANVAASSCGNSDIAVSLGHAGAAMNHDGQVVVFKNVSGHTCSLRGYPGAAVMSGGNALVNATRELNGYIGDQRQLTSAPLVTLGPGQSASAELEWVGDAGEQCYPDGSGGLAVTPPNTTKSTSLMAVTVGSKGICSGFEVHPVVAGIISG